MPIPALTRRSFTVIPLLLFFGLTAAGLAHGQSLREALDAAWARQPQARLLEARSAEIAARGEVARSLVPSPASVSLGGRTDRFHRNVGDREFEVELGVPVWLPGQRSAQIDLAQREMVDLEAQRRSLRLVLTAEIREAWIALEAARADAALARDRTLTARELEADVRRRLQAGEVSRFDANLAETERLGAEAALLEAEAKAAEAELGLRALTGLPRHGAYPAEASPDASATEHPRVLAGRSGVALSQAKLRTAAAATRDNPEVSLFMRRERGNFDDPFAHSVGVRVRIPFSSAPRLQAQVAGARAEADQAEAELRQTELRLELDQEKARRELAVAQQQAEFAQTRNALAADNYQLARKAFQLGESDLTTLLRVQSAAFDASRAVERARLALLAARGRVNQSLGVLP